VIEEQHRTPTLAGFNSAHQACRPGPDDDNVKIIQRIFFLKVLLGSFLILQVAVLKNHVGTVGLCHGPSAIEWGSFNIAVS
jgi:hypothetical protein